MEPFVGTDSQAVALITTLAPDYQPWVETWWRPPGPAVESFFFALQAALGAGVVGYYLGRRRHGEVHWTVSQGHEALSPSDSDKGLTDAPS
ncbi:Additional substrate-specific component CbiN of cobalt ECF transporter [invertebrate metagenome]|uniref:Additional substrate-specific component CbiN of cobalt ECF transporter n=1 Tax=invertebrate metagenome TaxID=1711999 RepID=A0A484H4R1_9ZZZZ